MTTIAWFFLIALCALSMASMSVQGWVVRTGEQRTAYIIALLVCATAGGLIAWDVSATMPYAVLGAIVGLAAIELGPHTVRLVVWAARAAARRVIGGDK